MNGTMMNKALLSNRAIQSAALVCVSTLLAGCPNPVVFQSASIDYFANPTMLAETGTGSLIATVSGKRCYNTYGEPEQKVHTFTLSDEVKPDWHRSPPNRIVLDMQDINGILPGSYYDYTLTLRQNGVEVERFDFRVINPESSSAVLKSHRFVISNNPDPTKPNSQGAFRKRDRAVGGDYYLSTVNGRGREWNATLYFPIHNHATVLSACPVNPMNP